jgi:hypothetical protein
MNDWEWQLLEDRMPLESFNVDGIDLKPGDRVRLRPRAGGIDEESSGAVATPWNNESAVRCPAFRRKSRMRIHSVTSNASA